MRSDVSALVIRCPVCCERFDGRQNTPEFDAFFAKHQACKGQSFDCKCEWERLCDSTTILVRVAPPCKTCAVEFPDGSCRRCPGCAECRPEKATSLSPLGLRVEAGLEDDRLLHHLAELERCESASARGLSDGEERLRQTVWRRLDLVTR